MTFRLLNLSFNLGNESFGSVNHPRNLRFYEYQDTLYSPIHNSLADQRLLDRISNSIHESPRTRNISANLINRYDYLQNSNLNPLHLNEPVS